MTPVIKEKISVPVPRRGARAPFSAITLFLSRRTRSLTKLGLRIKRNAPVLRSAHVKFVRIMAVYYLAKYRYFLHRPRRVVAGRSPSSGDSAIGPLIVRRYSRGTGPPRRRRNLWDLVGPPRRNARTHARSPSLRNRLGPLGTKLARIKPRAFYSSRSRVSRLLRLAPCTFTEMYRDDYRAFNVASRYFTV